jgi:hypothetical protein
MMAGKEGFQTQQIVVVVVAVRILRIHLAFAVAAGAKR